MAGRKLIQGGYGGAGLGNPNASTGRGGYGGAGLGGHPGAPMTNYGRAGLGATPAPSHTFVQGPEAGKPEQIPPGALVRYYSDLASGIVAPEDMRIESLEYEVTINPQGVVTAQTPPTQVVSRYNFALRRIVGFIQDPDLAGAAPSLVRFNVRDQGRNYDCFKRAINMQSLISRSGSGNVAEWDGTFIMVPGAQVEVSWSIDTANWPVLVGATKTLGIQLVGDYVVCQGFEGENR